MFIALRILLIGTLSLNVLDAPAQMVDIANATIVLSRSNDPLVLKSISVLQEEIQKRSKIRLPVTHEWKPQHQPIIAVGVEGHLHGFPGNIQSVIRAMPSIEEEGYKIKVFREDKMVVVTGSDPRGVLYGVGKLLRSMEMRREEVLVPAKLEISSSPEYPIRGHQLGYRPKTNSYDAWSPEQFDSYIRDLAIFGTNSIEIMPPRTDDDFTSVHMTLPAKEMIVEQSKICDSYGMNVWMWYPNMGSDYNDPDSVQYELDERREIFKSLPRLDALFVPGGDPGDLEPDELFTFLSQVSVVLQEYHPEAKIWVSPQVFRPTKAWFDAFYGHVNRQYDWFGGVVFGPWIKTPIREIRKIINPQIPIRRYPDITHSLSSQYPIPKWDLAYAITLGRECINPRPSDQKTIHNAFDHLAQGSISYSEGTNDDVNKFIWSDQDWDPNTPVIETLREYGRYFIDPDFADEIAQGILALEENIQGALLTNDGVLQTLQKWQKIEQTARRDVLSNYRFQMGLIRAYFDAYQYRRLLYETELEQRVEDVLHSANTMGSLQALKKARELFSGAWENPIRPDWKKRCLTLADSLFLSIGAQLTIEKHHAMGGRGNFIDNIDLPLNDVMWYLDQFSKIENLQNETDRLSKIDNILNRTDPGPGGFYNNFGSPRSWRNVKINTEWTEDPGSLLSPRVSFGVGVRGEEWVHEVTARGFEGQSTPMAWMNQVTTLYDQPLEVEYNNLDPNSSYSLRVAYTGRFRSRMQLKADDIIVHNYIQTGIQPIYEFPVPKEATSDGQVLFEWTCGEGERGSQVSEIWIIKK